MIRITDNREYQTVQVDVEVYFDNWNILSTSEDVVANFDDVFDFTYENAKWEPEDNGFKADFSHHIVVSTSLYRNYKPKKRLSLILKDKYEDMFLASFFSVEVKDWTWC